jgi:hypothetical protein
MRPPEPWGIMKQVSGEEMKSRFLTWQCRIRQIAVREHGGQPTPGMRPRVLKPSGECLMPAMTILILPEDTDESTSFFRFQVQKSPDPLKVYQSVLQYLQGEHYQVGNRFSDEMTALFEAGVADRGEARQGARLPARVRAVQPGLAPVMHGSAAARALAGARGDAVAQPGLQPGDPARCRRPGVQA